MALDFMPQPATVVVRDRGTLLTTTAATPVLGYGPLVTGMFWVAPIVIVQAAADLTLGMQWVDPITGDTVQYGWFSNAALQPGVYLPAPRAILAQGGQAIGVSATASVANAITVAGSILQLP